MANLGEIKWNPLNHRQLQPRAIIWIPFSKTGTQTLSVSYLMCNIVLASIWDTCTGLGCNLGMAH